LKFPFRYPGLPSARKAALHTLHQQPLRHGTDSGERNALPSAQLTVLPSHVDLFDLAVNPGAIPFDSTKMEYTLLPPFTTIELTVSALPADDRTQLTINGQAVGYGESKTVPLAVGNNRIQIRVTADNNITVNDYEVNAYRQSDRESSAVYPDIVTDGSASNWRNIRPVASGSGIPKHINAINDQTNLYLLVHGEQLNANSAVGFFYLNTDNEASTGFQVAGWNATGADYFLQENYCSNMPGTERSGLGIMWRRCLRSNIEKR
jgi:hypothetical protein